MKPFNLEEVKAGKPVCTRDGRKARIVCWDKKSEFPIIALVEEDEMERCINYTKEGYYNPDGAESKNDLFMDSEPAYRPFKSAEEVLEAILERGDLLKDKDCSFYTRICAFNDKIIWTGGATEGLPMFEAYNDYTFIDGTPFGKLEE